MGFLRSLCISILVQCIQNLKLFNESTTKMWNKNEFQTNSENKIFIYSSLLVGIFGENQKKHENSECLLYKAVQVDRFHLCPSNAEHVDCPFDHAYHIIPPNN